MLELNLEIKKLQKSRLNERKKQSEIEIPNESEEPKEQGGKVYDDKQ